MVDIKLTFSVKIALSVNI